MNAAVASTAVPDQKSALVAEAHDLRQVYPIPRGFMREVQHLHAVGGVSFTIEPARTLAVVGESGCGKSTLARIVALIERPTGGTLRLQGADAVNASPSERTRLRKSVQMVFQNPYASLNPRKKIGAILEAPLAISTELTAKQQSERARAMLAKVGLRPEHYARYPHMFSGGQRQRIAIARALMLNPALVVADEPVSALDVSVQAQVINLMIDLQDEFGIAYLFIAHDLAVVQHISHRVAVMYLGQIVELAPRDALFTAPLHPYTEALLDSVPIPDPALRRDKDVLSGEVPSPIRPPPGCRFHTRCPLAIGRCRVDVPTMVEARPDHFVACHVRAPAPSQSPEEETS